MDDPIAQTLEIRPTKALEVEPGVRSIGRIGFAFCLILAGIAVLVQVLAPFWEKTADNTTLIGLLLGFAFVGKVGQSFAEEMGRK